MESIVHKQTEIEGVPDTETEVCRIPSSEELEAAPKTILSLPTELHIKIYSYLDLDDIHIDSTCFGVTCKALYSVYRISKAVKRYSCLALRTVQWSNGGWTHLYDALKDWKGPNLVYNDNIGRFVRRERDRELVYEAKARYLTDLFEEWHPLGGKKKRSRV